MHANRVVVDIERPVGIFTERDLLDKVVTPGKGPADTLVGEVITKEVICIAADESIGKVRHELHKRRIRHAPVCEDEKVVGMISERDLGKVTVGWLQEMCIPHDLSGAPG